MIELTSLGEVFATAAAYEEPAPGVIRIVFTTLRGGHVCEVASVVMPAPALERAHKTVDRLLHGGDQPCQQAESPRH